MISLDALLKEANSVGIAGHINPDGDCTGSVLGLYNYIKSEYPKISVFPFLKDIPEVFNFLAGSSDLINPEERKTEELDVFFSLDCSDTARLGDAYKFFKAAKNSVCVDHHISNLSFAKENYIVPDASSTCELVFNLLDETRINKEIAECLYTGMVHDTGVFQYQATSSTTMSIAGKLMDKGIDYPKIIKETFYEKTYEQNRLLGKALLNSKLYFDGKVIASIISNADYKECNATRKDCEGIVAQLRVTKGCEVAIFLYQNEDGTYKASLRSASFVDVAKIAEDFNGGGHVRAAGANVGKSPQKAIETIIEKIKASYD